MKLFTSLAIASVLSLASASSHAAGSCGAGKITHIKEGGWNTDHFMIQIDYTVEGASSMSYGNGGYIRFLSTLDENRLQGIKALAYLAFSSGRTVRVFTSGTSCGLADDITLYAPGANFPNP